MKSKIRKFLYKSREIYSKYDGSLDCNSNLNFDMVGQEASDYIKLRILDKSPLMIARFGSAELELILNNEYVIKGRQHSFIKNSLNFVTSKTPPFWYNIRALKALSNNAGFFPISRTMVERFSEMMLKDMQQIDILGSWLSDEHYFEKELKTCKKVRLTDLEPYYHKLPWSSALEGKKVLVIHPFEDSIKTQYNKHELLFQDKTVLPKFELKTIKSVQSIAKNKSGFKSWFDAFDFMCNKINQTEFDVAIIGCGAYGLPLAAFVKRLGKKAVHLGGATQILFGIKGKRWEKNEFFSNLMNPNWIKPNSSELPKNFHKVEAGCYW